MSNVSSVIQKLSGYSNNRLRIKDGGIYNSLIRYGAVSTVFAGAACAIAAFANESPILGLIAFSVVFSGSLTVKGVRSLGRRAEAQKAIMEFDGDAQGKIKISAFLDRTRKADPTGYFNVVDGPVSKVVRGITSETKQAAREEEKKEKDKFDKKIMDAAFSQIMTRFFLQEEFDGEETARIRSLFNNKEFYACAQNINDRGVFLTFARISIGYMDKMGEDGLKQIRLFEYYMGEGKKPMRGFEALVEAARKLAERRRSISKEDCQAIVDKIMPLIGKDQTFQIGLGDAVDVLHRSSLYAIKELSDIFEYSAARHGETRLFGHICVAIDNKNIIRKYIDDLSLLSEFTPENVARVFEDRIYDEKYLTDLSKLGEAELLKLFEQVSSLEAKTGILAVLLTVREGRDQFGFGFERGHYSLSEIDRVIFKNAYNGDEKSIDLIRQLFATDNRMKVYFEYMDCPDEIALKVERTSERPHQKFIELVQELKSTRRYFWTGMGPKPTIPQIPGINSKAN